MKSLRWLVVATPLAAWAQEPLCYQWTITGSGLPQTTSGSEMCELERGRRAALATDYTVTVQSCSPEIAETSTSSGSYVMLYTRNSDGQTSNGPGGYSATAIQSACPAPPGCEEPPHKFTAGNVSGPNAYCNPVSHCMMRVTARTGSTMTVESTDEDCNPATDPPPDGQPEEDPDEEPETCQEVGDGTYCASPEGDGDCGYMNDTYICLQNIQENECKALGDGGRVCHENARTTPPVPDNGTAGHPATPDGEIQHETPAPNGGPPIINNYHYYNGGTVAGSVRDPGTTGAADNGGSPGSQAGADGNGDGDDPGDPGACVGAGCGATVPELEDVGTMTSAFQGFWDDLQAVPLVQAITDIAPTFGAGSCPTWSDAISVFGQTWELNFSNICDLWGDFAPVLTTVCLVFFGLIAVRILMSA